MEHALNIEAGGHSSLERFAFAWCPCGWSHEAQHHEMDWASDHLKQAFLGHLKDLRAKPRLTPGQKHLQSEVYRVDL